MDHFKKLNVIDVTKKTKEKDGFTYLPWAEAWALIKTHYPDANYKVLQDDRRMPFRYSEEGYIVETEATIEGITHSMWMPVLDYANMAMKKEPYVYHVWKKVNGVRTKVDRTCDAADMFDINRAIMRCLVKNFAMFGLGLYIYAGDDIPPQDEDKKVKEPPLPKAPPSSPKSEEQPQTATPPPVELTPNTHNWTRMVRYIESNRPMGIEKILAYLKTKFTISEKTEKEIRLIFNPKTPQ